MMEEPQTTIRVVKGLEKFVKVVDSLPEVVQTRSYRSLEPILSSCMKMHVHEHTSILNKNELKS